MKRYPPKLKPYLKKLEYSYSFGIYPTLDLLKYKEDRVLKVLLSEAIKGEKGEQEIIELCEKHEIPFEYNDRAIQKIAYKENTYAIGIFQKYMPILDDEVSHVVLVEPRNMGNIGTIVRTMLAFGISNLALIQPAADIFDPKVVRSAMGALFQINFEYYTSFEEYANKFPEHSKYPFMLEGGRDIRQIAVDEKYSLIFGNEAKGLPVSFSEIGQPVYIRQSSKVDSLNLSIAAGVAMWYFASVTGKIR